VTITGGRPKASGLDDYDSFRSIQLSVSGRPKTLRGWKNLIWGFDIFIGNVPFMKSLLLGNLLFNVLLIIL
jgi:hypothetical protein